MRALLFVLVFGSLAASPTPGRAAPPTGAEKSKRGLQAPQQQSVGSAEYKRIHQRALKKALGGDADAAAQSVQDYLGRDPVDAESHYMLGEIAIRRGQKEAAVRQIQKAIQLGLPPGRFVAGADSPFRKLVGNEAFDRILDSHAHVPVHGPMLGRLTGQSAAIWVRTAQPSDVQIVASTAADFDKIAAQGRGQTRAETDNTTVVTLEGLQPATSYFYRLKINGQSGDRDKPFTFRSFGPTGEPGRFSIVFGGGAGYVPPNERVWETIKAQQPQALLLLGDNVYSDDPTTPEIQNYSYYRRQSRPEFRRLVAGTPVYAIWDDHDFGTNDCWGGPDIETPAWKRPVWNVFRNNWVNPAYGGGRAQPGCWFDFHIGDVHFIMLDGRYYRTSPKTKTSLPSMLGPAQEQWLLDTVKASDATFKVLCSPVPWTFLAKGDSRDTWNGYRQQRDEIFGYLSKHHINGVVLMSADRHRSDLWKIDRPDDYPLYELSSSRLTNQHVHGTMKKAVFSYNQKQSFGRIDFDTTAADPTLTYQIVTIDGDTVFSFTIKHSQLVKSR